MRKISISQSAAYLRALAATGNATLAAEVAGVSRAWAYKRRRADPRFDAWCREMVARFREVPVPWSSASAVTPPLPLPIERRGVRKRVQRRRPRAGGWNAEREERFFAALAATGDVQVAAGSAGMTAPSAYRHRAVSGEFASRWADALAAYGPHMEAEWFESAGCFFEGEPAPQDNPVRVTSVGQVLRMLARSERAARKPT
jgi:hypothetical protein